MNAFGGASVREALDSAVIAITAGGSETPRLDAEILLADALGVDRAALFTDPAREVAGPAVRAFQDAVRRRSAGREPVAYITGRRGFRQLELAVDARVLVPRPETELLVEIGIELLADGARVADVGTGSGAIALALAQERPDLELVATDLSADALLVARANAVRLGLDRIEFREGDLLAGAIAVDAVLSNPPYVADGERGRARAGDHAPRAAGRALRRRRRARRDPAARAGGGRRGRRAAGDRGRGGPGGGGRGAHARRRLSRGRGAPRPRRHRTRRDRIAVSAFERCIAAGGVAVFPADTVYGLACDPTSAAAVERLYALKGRPADKPAAVMFFALEQALAALPELGPRLRGALEALLPGAVTLLLPNPLARYPLACGPDPWTLGLRVPAPGPLGGVTIAVLQSSANHTGGADPRTLAQVDPGAARGRRPRRRRRCAAGHAVDGRRPARLRARRDVVGAARGRRLGHGVGRGPPNTMKSMRIAIASDHAGFELKEHVKARLQSAGHDVVDVGPANDESTDYPRYARPAARLVAEGDAERGVLVCGSGVGVAIVANKVPGVRAVNAHDAEEAQLSRAHNDANVVTLSGRRLDGEQADEIVRAFLEAEFEGGRHARRVALIEER